MPYVATLTPEDVEFGRALTRTLGESGFPYSGTLWLYDDEADEWYFTVVTDLVDKLGPRKTYDELSTRKVPAANDQLLRISVMSPKHPTYVALRSAFGPAASVQGTRLQNTVVNGLYVTAHLYEIK